MSRTEEAYRIEAELARRLSATPRRLRTRVARDVYAELYRRVHWHPDLSRSADDRRARVRQVRYAYDRWIRRASAVLEVGAGNCEVIADAGRDSKHVRFVGIDVARAPRERSDAGLPENVLFAQAAAAEIPIADSCIDLVFSSQVLEHLHPEDVPDHLAEVARVLRPGGWLGFDTPNRLTGPHDISRGFTVEPTGLHLKEWTYREFVPLLRAGGFDVIRTRLLPGRFARALGAPPPGPLADVRIKGALERFIWLLPHRGLRRVAARIAGLDGIYIYARKAGA